LGWLINQQVHGKNRIPPRARWRGR
jgi:hypothetical protein